MVQLSHPYVTTGKTLTLTMWTFVKGFGIVSESEINDGKKKKKSMVTEKAHKLLSQSGEGPHPNPVKTRAGFQELRAQH